MKKKEKKVSKKKNMMGYEQPMEGKMMKKKSKGGSSFGAFLGIGKGKAKSKKKK